MKDFPFLFSLLFLVLPGMARERGPFEVETVVEGRGVIWGMEFLTPNKIIFTERAGKLSLLDLASKRVTAIEGGPSREELAHTGQGGLLDVKLHPQFLRNRSIFLTYSKRLAEKSYTTVLVQAELRGSQLQKVRELFRATPASPNNRHFGSRMAIKDGQLFFSVGDRGERARAQSLDNDWGKIHRLNLDGTVPPDNPFVKNPKARPSIYSYGHRNPQGLAFHPVSGELWEHEHGPRGGDEINVIKKGANYGWPVISYGKEYWGPIAVGEGTARKGMEQPLKYYVPSIAPCGMDFYRGDLYIGALALSHLNHLTLAENRITGENRLLASLRARVREVLAGPDGKLYISTDGGSIFKLSPRP